MKCRDVLMLLEATAMLCLIAGSMGCAVYYPGGPAEMIIQKSDLESHNFTVRKQGVQASASRTYILGMPFGPQAVGIPIQGSASMQTNAWSDLNKHWDGQGSVFYHNMAEEWSAMGVPPFFFVHQYTVTADLYEFTGEYVDYASRGERGQ